MLHCQNDCSNFLLATNCLPFYGKTANEGKLPNLMMFLSVFDKSLRTHHSMLYKKNIVKNLQQRKNEIQGVSHKIDGAQHVHIHTQTLLFTDTREIRFESQSRVRLFPERHPLLAAAVHFLKNS